MANAEGETNFEFIQFDDTPKVCAAGMTISFKASNNLEELRERAISIGYNPSQIINEPPKPEHFKVLDPDGIEVEFSL